MVCMDQKDYSCRNDDQLGLLGLLLSNIDSSIHSEEVECRFSVCENRASHEILSLQSLWITTYRKVGLPAIHLLASQEVS